MAGMEQWLKQAERQKFLIEKRFIGVGFITRLFRLMGYFWPDSMSFWRHHVYPLTYRRICAVCGDTQPLTQE